MMAHYDEGVPSTGHSALNLRSQPSRSSPHMAETRLQIACDAMFNIRKRRRGSDPREIHISHVTCRKRRQWDFGRLRGVTRHSVHSVLSTPPDARVV